MNPEANGWGEYRKLVVHELERLSNEIAGLRGDLQKVDRDVLSLKIKAGIWGGVAGTILGVVIRLIPALR
jgi:hypothetical protein